MRNTLIVTAAALVAFSVPALAQSTPAHPVMPAPRESTNPTNTMQTPSPDVVAPVEGRAAAPNGPVGETAPNGNVKEKARSGANGS